MPLRFITDKVCRKDSIRRQRQSCGRLRWCPAVKLITRIGCGRSDLIRIQISSAVLRRIALRIFSGQNKWSCIGSNRSIHCFIPYRNLVLIRNAVSLVRILFANLIHTVIDVHNHSIGSDFLNIRTRINIICDVDSVIFTPNRCSVFYARQYFLTGNFRTGFFIHIFHSCRVQVTTIIYINDCAAISSNRFLYESLRRESCVILRCRFCHRTGRSGLHFRFSQGILTVVEVFLPVINGISCIRIRSKIGSISSRSIDSVIFRRNERRICADNFLSFVSPVHKMISGRRCCR